MSNGTGIALGTLTMSIRAHIHPSADHDHDRPPHGGVAEVEPVGPATVLRAEHDHFDALASVVLDSIIKGDRGEAADAVALLQASVGAHLDGEERDLLPAYALDAPEDAQAILREHGEIREALAGLDLATDLHFLRADAVNELLGKLRAHAGRENVGLYRWAQARAR